MLATAAVLELAESIGTRLRCLVLLGSFAGLRTGELLGLQRRNIDLRHGTVTVVRQSREITGQGCVLTAPKSDARYRVTAPSRFPPSSWWPSSSGPSGALMSHWTSASFTLKP